jgi:hypothetical protein
MVMVHAVHLGARTGHRPVEAGRSRQVRLSEKSVLDNSMPQVIGWVDGRHNVKILDLAARFRKSKIGRIR